MYLHKYVSDGDTFYRVAGKGERPAGSVSLQAQDWKGKATGANVESGLSLIEKAFKEKKEEPKEKPEKKKKAALADTVRTLVKMLADDKEKEDA